MEQVIKSGKLGEFKQLIKNKSDLNLIIKKFMRRKPIHIASLYGRKDILEYLLANDVYVNDGDIENFTALHTAAEGGHTEIIIFLIVNKADVNAISVPKGLNFIHVAAIKGHVNILKEFFPSKEKSATKKYCRTLQQNATSRGDSETIENNIDNGADMQYECKYQLRATPLRMAAAIRDKCASIIFDKGISVETASNSGMTPFHYAAKYGHLEVVEYLAKIKANIHAKCKEGNAALHYSSINNRLNVVKLLIKLGCDVNAKNGNHFTPLHLASFYGHEKVMELLLKNSANLNDTVKGLQPIYIATSKGHKNAVKLLLRKGGNVNETDYALNTLLHKAVFKYNLAMVKFLISEGANINAVNMNYQKPIHIAASMGSIKIVEYFKEIGSDPNECSAEGLTPLHYAILSEKCEMVKFLIQNKALVCEKYPDGETPLMYVITNGLTDIALLLLEHGASNVANNEKLLHISVSYGNLALVKALIKCGFDPDELDFKKNTPLHIAAAQNELQIVKYLLEKGADPNIKDVYGSSTIMIAVNNGNLEIVNCLKESEVNHQVCVAKF